MKVLKNIRACFGIKNNALVHYLECSVDMVNSILCGRRSPNLHQLQAILTLHEALEWHRPVEELQSLNQLLEQERREASHQLEVNRQKQAKDLLRKKQELEALKAKRLAWLRGLHACHQLLETDLSPEKRKWVMLREKHLQQRLKEQSLFKEKMLEEGITWLEETVRVDQINSPAL